MCLCRQPFSADQVISENDWEVYLKQTAGLIIEQQSPARLVFNFVVCACVRTCVSGFLTSFCLMVCMCVYVSKKEKKKEWNCHWLNRWYCHAAVDQAPKVVIGSVIMLCKLCGIL